METKKCPCCGNSEYTVITTVTREGEGLWERCTQCGLAINRSGVPYEQVEEFYNQAYVKQNSFSQGEMLSAKEHFDARVSNIGVIGDYLKPYLHQEMRIFELGAGTGELLYHLKDSVGTCVANEINQLFTNFTAQELGIEASSENYFNLQFDEKFDMIISINTIDHIYGTFEVIDKVYQDLADDGYFYVEVPNDSQALRTQLSEPQRTNFQEFMYQQAHYFSFSFQTLTEALTQRGFKVVDSYSRHDYTINNYLNWYFLGMPQKKFKEALEETDIHPANNGFTQDMNQLFAEMNTKFKSIIQKHHLGESICILAQKQ